MKRFIQVGAGGWGWYWHTQVMSRLVRSGRAKCVAVVDKDPSTFQPVCESYGLSTDNAYTDPEKAFGENSADFVIIVCPPAHHEPYVDLALHYGMDILSEKPIADTMEACCRIYKKVNNSGRKMAVTMSHRFDQDKQTLERLIKSGQYGGLDYLIARNTWTCRKFGTWGEFRYLMEDPLLIEATVHHFDCMRAFAGSNAGTVYARTWNPEWTEFKGHAQAMVTVEMENGVRVFYEGAKNNASSLNDWTFDYWRAEMDKATLELDNRKIRSMVGKLYRNATIQEIPLENQDNWMNPWLAELFLDWINGGAAPENTLEDNIQCAALTFAAVLSAHTGQPVDVQKFLVDHLKAVEV